jgi:ferric-dicitrate binding protein FerR (iron transport regulator)
MKILRKISNRRRFAVIPALVAGALLLVAARAPVDDEQVGAVTGINGPAFAMQDAAPRVLKKGAGIFLGDVLSTGKGARLEIRMIDDAVFTLGERSLFVVQEYFLNQDKGNAAIRLMTGAIKVVTGKIAQLNTRPFELRTEVATIGVRGTTFWGGELDGVHQFALLEGRAITIENRAGRIEITKVGDGAKVDGPAIAPSPPRNGPSSQLQNAQSGDPVSLCLTGSFSCRPS